MGAVLGSIVNRPRRRPVQGLNAAGSPARFGDVIARPASRRKMRAARFIRRLREVVAAFCFFVGFFFLFFFVGGGGFFLFFFYSLFFFFFFFFCL
jgi:hypothetical protein